MKIFALRQLRLRLQPILQGMAATLPALLVKLEGTDPDSFLLLIEVRIQMAEERLSVTMNRNKFTSNDRDSVGGLRRLAKLNLRVRRLYKWHTADFEDGRSFGEPNDSTRTKFLRITCRNGKNKETTSKKYDSCNCKHARGVHPDSGNTRCSLHRLCAK